MHEGGLCEGVLAVVLDAAGQDQVRCVRLRLGRLQRVMPESFDFYWQMAASDTPAQGAAVDITEVALRVRCRACGGDNELAGDVPLCPICASADLEILEGDGVVVESVELVNGEILRNPNLTEIREDHTHAH